jgi:hypothetical protein
VDAGIGIMLADRTHKRSSMAIQSQTSRKGRGGTMPLFPLTGGTMPLFPLTSTPVMATVEGCETLLFKGLNDVVRIDWVLARVEECETLLFKGLNDVVRVDWVSVTH